MDGIFPRKVEVININPFTLLIEAAKVTNPDGINGISLPSKIRNPTFFPSPSTIDFNNLCLCFIPSAPFLKPNLYTKNIS